MKLKLVRAALVLAILSLPLVTASAHPLPPAQGKECEAAKKPASCPGGGEAKCVDGEWKCHELPHPEPKKCEAAKKPASCPGGGEAKYVDGEWKCHDLPRR